MNYIEHLFINLIFQNRNSNFSVFYSFLEQEIIFFKKHYQLNIKTIYIATEDLLYLSDQQLISFLFLFSQFSSENLIEYSFEIGYNTLTEKQLAILKQFKVNRLVWKVRTFNNKLLWNLNPRFNSKSLMKLIEVSHKLEFKNFSIDLEDNISLQTKVNIIDDLKIALKLSSPHISYQSNNSYCNQENRRIIRKFLQQYNYQNYEFFSFATNKKSYSQQTLGYLTLKNWYGLGPNAGGFLNLTSEIFVINNSNKIPWTKKVEKISKVEYYQLLIVQGLMLKKGFLLEQDYLSAFKCFRISITELINKEYLQLRNNYLKATNQGWNLLNQILIDIIKK